MVSAYPASTRMVGVQIPCGAYRARMSQGGERPLQGHCGEFDSHRVHSNKNRCAVCRKELLRPKGEVKRNKSGRFLCNNSCRKEFGRTGKTLRCEECGSDFYATKHTINEARFCSRSCAATSSNRGRNRHGWVNKYGKLCYRIQEPNFCLKCGVEMNGDHRTKRSFCSRICSFKYQKEKRIEEWMSGKRTGNRADGESISHYVRNYLFEIHDSKCIKCGWSEVHPVTGRVPLTVNHINGDSSDSRQGNLELICPNCHSLTPNYGSLNKGNGRRNRLHKLRQNR